MSSSSKPSLPTRFLQRLRFFLFAGILFTAPAGATIWLTWELLSATNHVVWNWVEVLTPPEWHGIAQTTFQIPGVGLVVLLLLLVALGMLTTNLIGRIVTQGFDRLLNRAPLVRTIYNWTRQLLQTVLSDREQVFRKAVLLQYPHEDAWTIGFLTGKAKGEIAERTLPNELYSVFVPATPNPTSGFLLFVPKHQIQFLDLGVQEAFQLLISGGMATPEPSDRPGHTNKTVHRKKDGKMAKITQKLRNALLAGLLVSAPLLVSVWLSWKLIVFVDQSFLPLLPRVLQPDTWLPFQIPGIGFFMAIVFLTAIGFLSANFLGRLLQQLGENLLNCAPFVRGIYKTLKQIMHTILMEKSKSLGQTALIEYPRPGIWAIAFVTGRSNKELGTENHLNLFLPTTPNPTSGFLLFQEEKRVIPLSMTIEEALKMIVSGGIVTPKMGTKTADSDTNSAPLGTTSKSRV